MPLDILERRVDAWIAAGATDLMGLDSEEPPHLPFKSDHPGQVAFPGGKIDPGEDAVEAALREAWEELGIRERDVTVIGTSDVYRTGSGYAITPVLAVVPPDIELNPSPTEVARWFEAPVDFVFDDANHTVHSGFWQGQERRYIEILWQEHRIWGVTAGIIANLAKRIAW